MTTEEKALIEKSKRTIFFEWLAIVSPILVCAAFLYGEIKDQRQRTDKLYETLISLINNK